MLEIFIPEKVWQKIFINNFSTKLEELIKKNFEIKVFKNIKTDFFEWKYLFLEKLDYNLIKIFNWEFWKFYFLDYDFLENKNIFSFGSSFLKFSELEKNIKKIWENIEEILKTLNSNKLLTNSKKEDITKKINEIFFTLSWILFVLYKNTQKLEENRKKLKNYNWLEEYEAQAELLLKNTDNQEEKLKIISEKFENMLKLYLESLEKIFIKL